MVESIQDVSMEESTSAGAIVCINGEIPRIILLIQNNEFYKRILNKEVLDIGPKGRIQEGSGLFDNAKREVLEELGLSVNLQKDFRAIKNYEFEETTTDGEKRHIKKSVMYFLALISDEDAKKIKLSKEHAKYEILSIEDAIKRVKFDSDKEILLKCMDYLKRMEKAKPS
ncbi:MAG TPA: NUDIX domain-containing protein [Candidatus Acidoferrum sp.]|nr:NUDIX domain-containing protein [Candidatus Acidoferrum sp.]